MAEPAFDPLLVQLRDVAELADPIPEAVLTAARAAFTWRTIDAELAELTADSLLAAAGVRASQAARLLTFNAPGVEIEVEVAVTGGARRLTGQLVPVASAELTVRWGDGATSTTSDDLGRFTAHDVPAGLVRIEIRRPSQAPIMTSWVTI